MISYDFMAACVRDNSTSNSTLKKKDEEDYKWTDDESKLLLMITLCLQGKKKMAENQSRSSMRTSWYSCTKSCQKQLKRRRRTGQRIIPHIHVANYTPRIHVATMASTRKLRSPVWEYCETVDANSVCCKLCMPPTCTILAYHGGTTSMKSHLMSYPPDKYEETSQAKTGSQCSL